MAFLFVIYAIAFGFVLAKKRWPSYVTLAMAIGASIAMFLYHANSSLDLNF